MPDDRRKADDEEQVDDSAEHLAHQHEAEEPDDKQDATDGEDHVRAPIFPWLSATDAIAAP